MEVVLGIVVVAALVGAVMWNHSNASAAMGGVEFSRPESPAVVVAAIQALYCGGAKAAVKKVASGVTVSPAGAGTFRVTTRIGDVGCIEVRPGAGAGASVRAATTELYIGTHPLAHWRSGLYRLAAVMAHGIYKVLGIAPNAAKMKRFQAGLEGRIARQVQRSARR